MSSTEPPISLPLNAECKLRLATFIKENKDILFARHSASITNAVKTNKWKDCFNMLLSHGAVISSPQYLRDRVWNNQKRGVMEKKSKYNSTGAAGGPRWTDWEKITLEVIDPDSAFMSGLGQIDAAPRMPGAQPLGAEGQDDEDPFNSSSQTMLDMSISSTATSFRRPLVPSRNRTSSPIHSETQENQDSATALGSTSTAVGSRAAKRPKGMGVPIWTSDEYKAAKIEEMNRNREEQSLRMELMRCQLEESRQRANAEKERAEFYRKAGLAIENTHDLVINREHRIQL